MQGHKIVNSRITRCFQWFVTPNGRKKLARCGAIWPDEPDKLHTSVVRSTFPFRNFQSKNAKNSPTPEHFWKLWSGKSARCCKTVWKENKYYFPVVSLWLHPKHLVFLALEFLATAPANQGSWSGWLFFWRINQEHLHRMLVMKLGETFQNPHGIDVWHCSFTAIRT